MYKDYVNFKANMRKYDRKGKKERVSISKDLTQNYYSL